MEGWVGGWLVGVHIEWVGVHILAKTVKKFILLNIHSSDPWKVVVQRCASPNIKF